VCMHVFMRACVHACVHVCMHACMRVTCVSYMFDKLHVVSISKTARTSAVTTVVLWFIHANNYQRRHGVG